ncbi:thioredoxin family protein [Mucilaginibacter terrenus]|uniref:Thioredoxin family protein n=1 Tax=Mucilaginibacter terrenus TaxID=2482727 RepID=A0A3E2NLK0_9SPHI|nr:thioredoxin family protein [Mucilaginibacter terrenus]RFZ81875.1 thioredoxin family protein [Mucilaginibacter terrenus]
MKLLLISFFLFAQVIWSGNFDEAQQQAHQSHKMIMVNFSGSDWCGPCIRLRKEILETSAFNDYAQDHLVLVRADFPRLKKNQLSKEQVKRNEALAEKYNAEGKFPFTLLLDENGKVLKTWDGYPDLTTPQFVAQIQAFEHGK